MLGGDSEQRRRTDTAHAASAAGYANAAICPCRTRPAVADVRRDPAPPDVWDRQFETPRRRCAAQNRGLQLDSRGRSGLQHLGGEHSSESAPVVETATDIEPSRDRPRASLDVVLQEREELLAKVRRLEAELERYRAHAQRTSRLFQSVSSYAEWVRESARCEAELTLKKARARADKTLGKLAKERERSQRELARLQELTAETRTRLSAFTAIALQVLDAQGVEAVQADRASQLAHATLADDLKDALEGQQGAPVRQAAAEPERPEVSAPADVDSYA